MTKEFSMANHFTVLASLPQIYEVLATGKMEIKNNDITPKLNLKDQETVDAFLTGMREVMQDCFDSVKSISKTLYYCDTEEVGKGDISNMYLLLAALGEIGAGLVNKYLDYHNSKPY